MSDFLRLMMGATISSVLVKRTKLLKEGFIISTVQTVDMGYETAICDREGAQPVERYKTLEEAEKGHTKWEDFIVKGNRKVTKLGFASLVDDKEIDLIPCTLEELESGEMIP